MKKILVYTAVFLVLASRNIEPKNLKRADGIAAVVRTLHGTTLIMQSELERPYLDGTPNTLQNAIMRALLTDEARRFHMLGTPEETEKQLQMVAHNNHVQLDQLFAAYGYTYEEGKKAFAEMTGVNNLISLKITANIFISDKEARAYYDEHPEYEEPAYYVQCALIPFSTKEQILGNETDLPWQDPFWLQEDEISTDKQFIMQLTVGQISDPHKTSAGLQVFKLLQKKERRLKPFEERYREIVDLLRRPKYEQMLKSYQDQLLESASITYFVTNPASKGKE